ncbi:dihydrofolate reductase family protein [Streptomyces sp. SAS_270]|uniref:dihydrofolate reductase family protein n=1 Tax=Streptomyces sp. SAS_270 TaxID=3412748 RepID=UPI00403CB945
MRRIAPVRSAGSLRASTARRVARSRSSSEYLRGAAMIGILPGLRCLHQTRGDSDFWPTADKDPGSTPVMVEFSGIWRDMPKVVYSRTLARADWNTTVVREVVPEEVRALTAQPGGDLGLGGADLAATFLRHDLVDEFRVYVHPVILGRGKRLFPDADALTMLRLAETRAFGNGVVLLRYERANTPET